MKVQIDGNIIDTTLIYRIGEIKNVDYLNNTVFQYWFIIYFLNKHELKVNIHISESPILADDEKYYSNNDYIKASSEILERITNCRNKLIEIWKENQSCIPEIKL